MPSNHVRAIAQDNDGILWFGTDSGLAKYDGRRIQKVLAPGLPNGRIRALKLDPDGTLWVGTDSGATRYSAGQFKEITETDGKAITAFAMPDRGNMILVSDQGNVFTCAMQSDGSLKVKTTGPNDSPLLKLETNGNQNPLPLAGVSQTKDGLIVATRGRGLLLLSADEVKEIVSRPRSFFINASVVDDSGHLWFGADAAKNDGGLYSSDDLLHPQKIDAETGPVKSITFDQSGSILAGTDGQGVFRVKNGRVLDHFTFDNTAGGLRSNLVFSIFVDREGVVWFGTDRGVCRYDPHSPRIEPISDSPGSNFVRTLYKAKDGREWCGTNRGLFTRDAGVTAWRAAEDLSGKTIHSINEDQSGHILVGTAGGIYRGAPDPFSLPGWFRFSKLDKGSDVAPIESVRAICHFRDGIYLAGFSNGVERLDGDNRKLIWPTNNTDSRQRNVVSLYADGNDRLWIGTAEAGVFYFDGNKVIKDPALSDIHDETVWSVAARAKILSGLRPLTSYINIGRASFNQFCKAAIFAK